MSSLTESGIDTSETEADRVEKWRVRELIEAGFSADNAVKIAARHLGPDAIDLHEAIELVVEKGCDPELAADILL